MHDNVTSGTDAGGGLGWRASLARAGGGIVIDGGLHWIRPLREICGEVEAVVGVARRGVAPELAMEGESVAHALLRFAPAPPLPPGTSEASGLAAARAQPPGSGELFGTFSANMMGRAPMAHGECPYFRWTGTEGELVIAGTGLFADGGGGLTMYSDTAPKGERLFPPDRQGGFFLGFEGLWREAARVIGSHDKRAALRTVRSAAADVAVALALYRSAESGAWEAVESFEHWDNSLAL